MVCGVQVERGGQPELSSGSRAAGTRSSSRWAITGLGGCAGKSPVTARILELWCMGVDVEDPVNGRLFYAPYLLDMPRPDNVVI
jgi:hypothetical protein